MRRLILCWFAVLAQVVLPLACETREGGTRLGSESHFLRSCQSDDDCAGLSCLCGVCSAACSGPSECSALHQLAECFANSERSDEAQCPVPPTAMCDVSCEISADCSFLGAGFSCQSGFCREGSSAALASATAAGGSSAGSAGGAASSGSAGSSSDLDIVADGQVELFEICAMYQDSVCTKLMACDNDPGYCSPTHCEASIGCSGFQALSDSVAAGRLTYDAAAAADCYRSIQADPCEFSYQLIVLGLPSVYTLLNACPGVLQARQQLGDTCYLGEDCVFGTHCDNESTCPGTCVLDDPPLGEAGDPCTTVFGPHQRCVAPLVCMLGANTESGEQECGPPPSVGDPCSSAAHCRCNGPAELCNSLGCDQSLGQCVPRSQVGEPCSDLDAAGVPECAAPLWCDGGFSAGVCQPLSPEGGPCGIFSDCQDPLVCIDDVCVPAVVPGERCTFGGDCIRGDCVDGVCAELATSGAVCEYDLDCDLGLTCSQGVCLARSCPDEPCDASHACLEGRCVQGLCEVRVALGQACGADDDCAKLGVNDNVSCLDGVCTDMTQCR